ncbi:hypothetical protein KL86CLO1_20009 [uncultured Eubacteriales bacterium]|uniref:Uncharacterized protein n=1 Tax=uncultured Eubacteriales bacterium TaxID=172733 RepID=A0A212KLJ4_9FIRM|nr:hypothetical protein KL86CLO1_20009 [uncultured Eubacteriales bacterium]
MITGNNYLFIYYKLEMLLWVISDLLSEHTPATACGLPTWVKPSRWWDLWKTSGRLGQTWRSWS